ncbi:MAG: hypothetical protein LBR50_10500 [Tannerella sp.]|jgi:hypothetical protein|nr:hypothetical protein [Tannerella sp.]
MNRNDDDLLKKIFENLPKEESLPSGFRISTMERVRLEHIRMQKRNARLQLLVQIASALVIGGLAAAALVYLRVSLPKFTLLTSFTSSSASPFLMLGAIASVLILLDYLFRQAYSHRKYQT